MTDPGERPTAAPRNHHGPWWRRLLLGAGVDLRSGEARVTALLFITFFLITTFQIATKTVRQSTFVDSLGAERLPFVYLLVALTSYPFLSLYNRFADRLATHRLLAVSSFGTAGALVAFWLLFRTGWPWVPVLFYLASSIVYAMLISQFWTYGNQTLDPRQARRLFGLIGAGGLLGGIAGGQAARLVTRFFGTGSVLLAAAMILAAVALLMLTSRSSQRAEPEVGRGGSRRIAALERARGGFNALKGSALLRWIAVLMVLSVAAAQIVDLQFNWAVERATAGLDQRTAFFGNFFSVLGVSAFLFQLFFTSRIHRGLGVGFALRLLPLGIAIGTVALLLAAGLLPAFLVGAALLLKIGDNGLRYSLDQATRELLFVPVPERLRRKAKAFIDVFIQRGAKGLAALLLLPVTFGLMTAAQAGWFTLALVAVWLGVAAGTYREYVRSFRQGLARRTVETAIPINLADGPTLELLMQSLASSDRRQVLHGLELISAQGRGNLVPPLLLYHDDPEIRRRTLEILAEAGRIDATALIERRLGDDDPDVRAQAIQVLADLQGKDVCELMLPRLEEADPGVRAAAVACLANYGDEEMSGRACQVLEDLLSDERPEVRGEGAKAIGAVREPIYQEYLVRLLYDPSPHVVRQAIGAVRRRVARDGYNPLYVPTLVSLLQNRRVKHDARAALIAFDVQAVPALTHFLNDPDEPLWVRRSLPMTLAQIPAPAAAEALFQGLENATDLFLRRKLIEAMGQNKVKPAAAERDGSRMRAQITVEAKLYLEVLARLEGLGVLARARFSGPRIGWQEDYGPGLVERLLAERAEDHLWNLFGLLALLYGPEHVWAAYRSLVGDLSKGRAHALEYLENSLSAELQRLVAPVIDDRPIGEKLLAAGRQFDIRVRTRVETLQALLAVKEESRADQLGLRAAALYSVYTDGVSELYPLVESLAQEDDELLIRETATWVSERVSGQPAGAGGSPAS